MKKVLNLIFVLTIVMFLSSCSRSITPNQAANGKAKCGKWLK